MQISSGPNRWQPPRKLPAPDPVIPPKHGPDNEGDEPELIEKVARWVGQGSQGMAMAPQFLASHPWILESLRLKHLTPMIDAGAAVFGTIGTVSLAAAGTKDMVDGFRHKNTAEILSGASDIARGAYVGSFAAALAAGTDQFGLSRGFGIASGLLQTAGGLARMRHHKKDGNPVDPKVVGALEVGQGLAWAASMAGAPVGLCFVVKAGLGAARTLYTHQQNWQNWTQKTGGS